MKQSDESKFQDEGGGLTAAGNRFAIPIVNGHLGQADRRYIMREADGNQPVNRASLVIDWLEQNQTLVFALCALVAAIGCVYLLGQVKGASRPVSGSPIAPPAPVPTPVPAPAPAPTPIPAP